jgi:hypothetical protein
VNKTASHAVYAVVAVALVFAASAQATPLQSASTLLAFTATQLSLTFDTKGSNFDGMPQSGTLLLLRNIGSQIRNISSRPALEFEAPSNTKVSIFLETSPDRLSGPVILPVAIPAGTEATGQLHWDSSEVFDNSWCFSPASVAISFGLDVRRGPFTGHLCGPSSPDAKSRLAYLKRDLVYVRSKP